MNTYQTLPCSNVLLPSRYYPTSLSLQPYDVSISNLILQGRRLGGIQPGQDCWSGNWTHLCQVKHGHHSSLWSHSTALSQMLEREGTTTEGRAMNIASYSLHPLRKEGCRAPRGKSKQPSPQIESKFLLKSRACEWRREVLCSDLIQLLKLNEHKFPVRPPNWPSLLKIL